MVDVPREELFKNTAHDFGRGLGAKHREIMGFRGLGQEI